MKLYLSINIGCSFIVYGPYSNLDHWDHHSERQGVIAGIGGPGVIGGYGHGLIIAVGNGGIGVGTII